MRARKGKEDERCREREEVNLLSKCTFDQKDNYQHLIEVIGYTTVALKGKNSC